MWEDEEEREEREDVVTYNFSKLLMAVKLGNLKDPDCVSFLKQNLPQLHLRWSGFRRVRRQVCRRLRARFRKLGLEDFASYRNYLVNNPDEWSVVDACCRVTISRFYRDALVFEQLCQILPTLIQLGQERGDSSIRCWCAGCASGEEVYTLKLIEHFCLSSQTLAFLGRGDLSVSVPLRLQNSAEDLTLVADPADRADPTGRAPRAQTQARTHHRDSRQKLFLPLSILGTDVDEYLLLRARRGCYSPGTLKELPQEWIAQAFDVNQQYCLKSAFQERIQFERADIRKQMPEGLFHLILCRYLAFTYFEPILQQEILQGIIHRLVPEGILVIGKKESLPFAGKNPLIKLSSLGIYQKQTV